MRPKGTKPFLLGLLAITACPAPVLAGPCSDDIAAIGRQLSASPALGPATTGALAGSGPGTVRTAAQGDEPGKAGTTADGRIGGTAGTKELNAAVGQVATSAEDVRRQQEGLPTAAQMAAQGSGTSVETTPKQGGSPQPDDRVSQAKTELEKARALDQRNDGTCSASVKRTRDLIGS